MLLTTGNICPGMNDTIEAMVKRLQDYGVPEENVMGIRCALWNYRSHSSMQAAGWLAPPGRHAECSWLVSTVRAGCAMPSPRPYDAIKSNDALRALLLKTAPGNWSQQGSSKLFGCGCKCGRCVRAAAPLSTPTQPLLVCSTAQQQPQHTSLGLLPT